MWCHPHICGLCVIVACVPTKLVHSALGLPYRAAGVLFAVIHSK